MKHAAITKRICAFALALTLLAGTLPSASFALADGPDFSANNARAIVARGEDAFGRSDYAFSAKWIWSPSDDGAANRWMAFRKDMTLTASDLEGEITAKIAADTKYWLWINGELAVYEGQLKRGAALLKKDIYPQGSDEQPDLDEMVTEVATYCDEVVLTPYLREGENVIAALVWYYGNEGHSHVGSGKGAFLFESRMGGELVVSDSSWKVSRHMGYQPSSRVNVHAQEFHIVYDARQGFDGFYKPEFDASGWENAAEVGAAGDKPWNELWPRPIPEWKVWDRESYPVTDTEHIQQISGGYRVLFPTNIHFGAYLKVIAPAGKTIKVSCPNAGRYSVTYVTKGGENGEAVEQEYESPAWINWWYADFAVPSGVEVVELGYRRSGYNAEEVGYFDCNDDFYDTLWRKAADTVYVNVRDTFMDCPDSERAPWLGDMVNEAQIAYYTLDERVFDALRKDISVRINWQNEEGVISSTAPASLRYNEWAELPGQSLAGVMSWFQYYLYSGDRLTLEKAYPALLKYISLFRLDRTSFTVPFERRNGTNTQHLSWVDWGNNVDTDLCLNIWAYIGVKTVVDFATALGDAETAEYYSGVRGVMASKFDRLFWNGSEYRSSTYAGPADDRAQALAVFAGLVSPDKFPALRDILLNNKFASPYMVKYCIEALYIMGYPDAAEQRMKESYYDAVTSPNPTLPERWTDGSANHGWAGGGLVSLSGYAAGVRPLEAGYEKFIVKPQLGGRITKVNAGIPSVKGLIEVEAEKNDGGFTMTVNVPEGSAALLAVPRAEGATAVVSGGVTIWNNGVANTGAVGITYAYDDYSHVYFEAGPGEWSVGSYAAPKPSGDSFTLKINETENGGAEVNGTPVALPYEESFAAGTQVTVEAIPARAYCFAGFDGTLGSRESALTLTMDADAELNVRFAPTSLPFSENYALGCRTVVSTAFVNDAALRQRFVNDGVRDTRPGENEGWSSKNVSGGRSEWVYVNLGEPKAINQLVIYPRVIGDDAGFGIPEDFTVSVSDDGESWYVVREETGFDRPTDFFTVDFDGIEAQYVKFEGAKFRGNPYNQNRRRMQIAELEVCWYGETPVKLGELDGDGKVTVSDALLTLRIAAGLLAPSEEQASAGDFDGDGRITVADALSALRCAVGLARERLV